MNGLKLFHNRKSTWHSIYTGDVAAVHSLKMQVWGKRRGELSHVQKKQRSKKDIRIKDSCRTDWSHIAPDHAFADVEF